jgi:hypothetical protein
MNEQDLLRCTDISFNFKEEFTKLLEQSDPTKALLAPSVTERIKFAEEYISKQFLPMSDCDSKSMEKIIKHVNPQDSFDIATVLFIYEKNHNTIDSNRMWTIDDLPNTVSDCIKFLISNKQNYLIF